MKLLFLDFEATGVDPLTARPIEYCFRFWNTDTGLDELVKGYMWDDSYGEVPEEVVQLTGITTAKARTGSHPSVMLEKFAASIGRVDFVIAHNAAGYDRVLVETESARHGITLPPAKWIDTMTDLPYPEKFRCRKLSHLAVDHEIPFDPSILHGAEADVDLLKKIVEKYTASLDKIAHASQAPVVAILALVSYDQRELAKKEAYRWSPDTVRPDTKKKGAWLKKVRDFQVSEETAKAAKAGFKIFKLSE